jgi:amphi-Trp domain-containing protein
LPAPPGALWGAANGQRFHTFRLNLAAEKVFFPPAGGELLFVTGRAAEKGARRARPRAAPGGGRMKSFHHSFVSDPEDAARYLEALIEGFRSGALKFTSKGQSVVLEPAQILEMSIETGSRKGRTRLALTVSWPDGPESLLRPPGGPGLGLGPKP